MAALLLLYLLIAVAVVAIGAFIVMGQRAARKLEKPNDVTRQPPLHH